MALSKRYLNHPLVLDTTVQSGTDTYLDLASFRFNPGLATGVVGPSGEVYNTFGFLRSGNPSAAGTTLDVKVLLDNVGATGMLIDTGALKTGVIAYFQKAALGSTRTAAATAEHQSLTFTSGLMVTRSISLSHQGDASAAFEIYPVSTDGTTAPFTFAETATVPAAAYPALGATYTFGKCMLNAVTLDGAIDCQIDMGYDIRVEAADGNLYPTHVYIHQIQPTITLSSHHVDLTSTLTEAGLAYSSTQVVIYGRQRAEGGTYTADGTSAHLKFTLGKCRVEPTSIDGEPEKRLGVKIIPYATPGVSPVAPIAISTASAIT